MEFGIFDHVDADGQPLQQMFETRLRVVETYERLGFRSYHPAEHHFTPLGIGAAPSVWLSAVAQRTRRLRFGPLIYALPFTHPIRLAEEIAMLDHMSGGRLEMGFGRGASPIELAYVGYDAATADATFREGLAVVLAALTSDRLSFSGERFRFEEVPIQLRPLQQPHPPLWYGLHSPDSADRVARQGWNVVVNERPSASGKLLQRFREVWRDAHPPGRPLPLMGLVRHIVVAGSDEHALAIARRAYERWLDSFLWLFKLHGAAPTHWEQSRTFDILRDAEERGIAGSPKTVIEWLSAHIEATGANYLVGQHQFGDMSLEETLTSIGLYASEVMPELRRRFG
jgi:alkanesulfonate monooxygenase SsuD/methylene tetrahydromethanopterin reductase-like flavin-dependent oxidoreductase (luciferase family)